MATKSHHHQSLKLLPIAALLIVTPLLSSSLRFKYLYFIVNILIIAVGAEAGLVSFFLRSAENKKPYFSAHIVKEKYLLSDKENTTAADDQSENGARPVNKSRVEEKCFSDYNKVFVEVNVPKEAEKLLSPSNPSIFFVGGGESENIITEADQELIMEDVEDEELFQKAEMFIGNFYKQLKMQREESRKKLVDQ